MALIAGEVAETAQGGQRWTTLAGGTQTKGAHGILTHLKAGPVVTVRRSPPETTTGLPTISNCLSTCSAPLVHVHAALHSGQGDLQTSKL